MSYLNSNLQHYMYRLHEFLTKVTSSYWMTFHSLEVTLGRNSIGNYISLIFYWLRCFEYIRLRFTLVHRSYLFIIFIKRLIIYLNCTELYQSRKLTRNKSKHNQQYVFFIFYMTFDYDVWLTFVKLCKIWRIRQNTLYGMNKLYLVNIFIQLI